MIVRGWRGAALKAGIQAAGLVVTGILLVVAAIGGVWVFADQLATGLGLSHGLAHTIALATTIAAPLVGLAVGAVLGWRDR